MAIILGQGLPSAHGDNEKPILEPTIQNTKPFDPASHERDLYALLDTFAGVWKGTLILSTESGQVIKLVSLNQSYWWEDHVLKGLAAFGNDTRIEYAFSETTVENGTITAIIREGDKSKVMQATPTDQGLVWVPADPNRIGKEQSSEYITLEDGKDTLVIDGFERVNNPPLEQRILIRAELVKQDEDPQETRP